MHGQNEIDALIIESTSTDVRFCFSEATTSDSTRSKTSPQAVRWSLVIATCVPAISCIC